MGKGRDITHYAPTGIVSVASNYDINWFGEQPLVQNSVSDFIRNTLWRRNDQEMVIVSKADVLVNDADSLLRTALAGAGFGEFAEKDRILQAQSYSNGKINPIQEKNGMIPAEGYRLVYYRDKAFIANMAGETGIQSGMFVAFNFTKNMASGIGKQGTFRVQIDMEVIMVNREGKMIYSKTFNITGHDRIPVSGGAYYHEDLMDSFQDILAEACDLLIADLKPAP
jgi:hypothetical protein